MKTINDVLKSRSGHLIISEEDQNKFTGGQTDAQGLRYLGDGTFDGGMFDPIEVYPDRTPWEITGEEWGYIGTAAMGGMKLGGNLGGGPYGKVIGGVVAGVVAGAIGVGAALYY